MLKIMWCLGRAGEQQEASNHDSYLICLRVLLSPKDESNTPPFYVILFFNWFDIEQHDLFALKMVDCSL